MSRWKHDAGDCWPDRCEFCARETSSPRVPTPDEMAELRRMARQGAETLAAKTVPLDSRHQPTPTEELARARARADKDNR